MGHRKKSAVRTESWHGFSVTYLNDSGADWLSVFKKVVLSPSSNWTLLQNISRSDRVARIDRVWKVDDPTLSKIPFILKRVEYPNPWNFDRYFRLLFQRPGTLLKSVQNAHSHGFTFPMKIFVAAERREHGALRERYSLTEFINGKGIGEWNSGTYFGKEKEVLDNVIKAHKFGITWGGDPNPSNMMIDDNGQLRGIDLLSKRAFIDYGKDLNYLCRNGCVLPRFYLSVAISRLQDRYHWHK